MTSLSILDILRRVLDRDAATRLPSSCQPDPQLPQPQPHSQLPAVPAALPTARATARPRTAGPAAIALIREFEGCARRCGDGLFRAYPDPGTGGAPWTIGWGATGPDIGRETVWTQDQCDARLDQDIARHALEVDRALGDAPTTQPQFDALVSFHYNTGAIRRATLTRKHCGGDHAGALKEFSRWTYAGGRVLPGLVRRRAAEAELYAAE